MFIGCFELFVAFLTYVLRYFELFMLSRLMICGFVSDVGFRFFSCLCIDWWFWVVVSICDWC